MLFTTKDNLGNIQAVCEYNKVNQQGKLDKQGKYVYIANVDINPSARNNGILKKFIKMITDKFPDIEYGYFKRDIKYSGRRRMYTRQQWLNRIKEN